MEKDKKQNLDFKRLVPPVFFAALSGYYLWIASGFSDDTSAESPMLYGTVLFGLSVLVFILALIPSIKATPKRSRGRTHETVDFKWLPSLQIFGLVAGFIAAVFVLGFYIAIPCFLLLFLKFVSRASWRGSVICAVTAFGFTWLIFAYFLHLEVFAGYLGNFI